MADKTLLMILLFTAGVFTVQGQGSYVMAQTDRTRLPHPRLKGSLSLEETILKRRSQRTFLEKA